MSGRFFTVLFCFGGHTFSRKTVGIQYDGDSLAGLVSDGVEIISSCMNKRNIL